MAHPPKRHVFLEFLVENKAFHFSKRTLCADIACSKWLKKGLLTFKSFNELTNTAGVISSTFGCVTGTDRFTKI